MATYADLPAGTILGVIKSSTSGWPSRPTSRSDLIFFWIGPSPAPTIVSSGTGGMIDNVDEWLERP